MPEGLYKILIVDDEPNIRSFIKQILHNKGFEIFEAPDGNAALKILDETPMDLLVMDVIMPGKGGIETALEIRKKNNNVKLVLITGKMPEDTSAFQNFRKQFSVDAFFTKPFDIIEFRDRVLELVKISA